MNEPLDPFIDSQLRNIPAPEGLAARFRQIAEPTDENIDGWLQDVPVPNVMLSRCRSIPEFESIEESICDVEVPVRLLKNLRSIPHRRSLPSFQVMARAAVLFLLVGGAYASLLAVTIGANPAFYGRGRAVKQVILAVVAGESDVDEFSFGRDGSGYLVASDEIFPSVVMESMIRRGHLFTSVEVAPVDGLTQTPVAGPAEESAPKGFGSESLLNIPSSKRLLAHRYSLSRSHMTRENMLASNFRSPLIMRGGFFQPNLGKDSGVSRMAGTGGGWDVSHDSYSGVMTQEVPVTKQTSSFDVLEEFLADGKWPQGMEVRTEEFLAAMNYGFPPAPRGQIALHPAGCTLSEPNGSHLLQIGVKVGGAKAAVPGETSEEVASQATVTIHFNPQLVRSYRLIGHEPKGVDFELPVVIQSPSLQAGDETVLLFEVWMKPGQSPVVADVELNWYDLTYHQSKRVNTQILKYQIAEGMRLARPSLQVAAVAAETAEVLRSNRFSVIRTSGLWSVRETLRNMNNKLTKTSEFERLVKLVDAAIPVRPDLLGK